MYFINNANLWSKPSPEPTVESLFVNCKEMRRWTETEPLFLTYIFRSNLVLCNIVQAFSHNSKLAFSPIFIRAISCVAALFILIFYWLLNGLYRFLREQNIIQKINVQNDWWLKKTENQGPVASLLGSNITMQVNGSHLARPLH